MHCSEATRINENSSMKKSLKKKTLCDWKKSEILDNLEELFEIVETPEFICKKCARAANQEKSLCKPLRFKDKI